MKKITIGLVTYNRPILLRRAVQSILNQSYKNFVLYIGNDYISEDITFSSLGIKKNANIIIYNHKKNLGERENLNFLLKKSKTEWFCWLGDDDFLHKDFFKILYNGTLKFKQHKIVASYSDYSRKKFKIDKRNNNYLLFKKEDFLIGYTSKNIRLIGTFGLIKTTILKKLEGIPKTGPSLKINGIKTNHYPYCDPLLAMLLSKEGKIIWINKKLVYLNTDSNSITARTTEYKTYVAAEYYVLQKLRNITKNFKNKMQKNQVFDNMIKWFFINRAGIIERRNPFINIFFSLKLIIDTFVLFNNHSKKNLQLSFNHVFEILKAIFRSAKKK